MKKLLYNWLYKVGLTLCAALILPGCADDNFSAPSYGEETIINFAVAEPTVVTTRAGVEDSKITDITFLAYNSSNELVMKEDLAGEDSPSGSFSRKVTLSQISTVDGDITFYAITNAKSLLSSVSTTTTEGKKLSTLQAIENTISTATTLTMSAKVVCKKNELTGGDKVFRLNRNSSRLKVGVAEPNEIEPAFEVKTFKVVGGLPTTYTVAAADGTWGTGTATTLAKDETGYVYMAPKQAASDISVLIQATYNGVDGWYRTSLKGLDPEDRSKEKVITSIEPNHEYRLLVNKVIGPGYPDENAALNAPVANMEVVVIDHAPKIYSLVTTGTHTLGVEDRIEVKNTAVEDVALLIKTICKEGGDCTVSAKPVVTVVEGSDWINIKGGVVTTTAEAGSSDPETPTLGNFWKQTLTVSPLVGGEYREGKLKVQWEQLTRTVVIAQSGKFNGSALGKFTINMTNSPSNVGNNTDYFEHFLPEVALGVDKDAMCGIERTQGFHFPIGLQSSFTKPGVAGTLTSYSYTLSSIKNEYQGSYVISLKSGSRFGGKLKINGTALNSGSPVSGEFNSSSSISISLTDTSWDYIAEPKALSIVVTKGGKTTTFTYDLYKTGFFYTSGQKENLMEGTPQTGRQFYYEVIKTVNDGKTMYWLDRNIGATAAGMYIRGAAGNTFQNETSPFVEGSQGFLYGIGKESSNVMDNGTVPPGFRVPTISEFNNLTNSADFITVSDRTPVSGATYWTAYFSDLSSERQIHFPKNRYKSVSGAIEGDLNAGYYWTRSEALGASGSEAGKWFQAVKISGGASSTIRIKGYDGAYVGMSVRAVKNEAVEEKLFTYKLKVEKGFTNVYLYTIDETGARIPLNNWPGDQIHPYNVAADAVVDYNFYSLDGNSYYGVTGSNGTKKIYVILNKIDSKGAVIESWSDETGIANPSTNGKYVASGSSTPWSTRITVPATGFSGGNIHKYVVYWNIKKMGSNVKQLEIKDGTNVIKRDGNKYSTNSNYLYVEYNTESSQILVAPYNPIDKWTYNKDSESSTVYWTIDKQSGNTTYYTINTYDKDGDEAYHPQCKYGTPN